MHHPLTYAQAFIACIALAGITVLGVTGDVSEGSLTAIYSAVIGAGLGSVGVIANGYANGGAKKKATE
jgi:hypothetical protein